MMSDYKSRELTLYNDSGYKLQVRPIDGSTDAGPGFSIKTTNLQNAGDWGGTYTVTQGGYYVWCPWGW